MTILKESRAISQTRIICMFLQIMAFKSKVIKTWYLCGTCYLSVVSTVQHVLQCFLGGALTYSKWTILVTLISFWSRPFSTFNSYHLLPFFWTVPPRHHPACSCTHLFCNRSSSADLVSDGKGILKVMSSSGTSPDLFHGCSWKDRRSLSNCATSILTQHLPGCYIVTFCYTSELSDAEIHLELQFLSSISVFWNKEMWNTVHAYVAYYAIPLSYIINALKKINLEAV